MSCPHCSPWSFPSSATPAESTSHGRNYDEAKVGDYTLPDPLLARDGRHITTPDEWNALRRGESLHDFRDLMYAVIPQSTLACRLVPVLKTRKLPLYPIRSITLRMPTSLPSPSTTRHFWRPERTMLWIASSTSQSAGQTGRWSRSIPAMGVVSPTSARFR